MIFQVLNVKSDVHSEACMVEKIGRASRRAYYASPQVCDKKQALSECGDVDRPHFSKAVVLIAK